MLGIPHQLCGSWTSQANQGMGEGGGGGGGGGERRWGREERKEEGRRKGEKRREGGGGRGGGCEGQEGEDGGFWHFGSVDAS